MDLPKRIELIEVCPRDGFQSVHDIIPFEGKVAIIKKLAEAGFKRLEVVSFVSPKAIPQMADAKEVVAAVRDTLKAHGVRTVALVPNARGLFRPGVKKAEPPTDGSAQLRQKCRNFCTSRSAPRTSIVSPSRKQ